MKNSIDEMKLWLMRNGYELTIHYTNDMELTVQAHNPKFLSNGYYLGPSASGYGRTVEEALSQVYESLWEEDCQDTQLP